MSESVADAGADGAAGDEFRAAVDAETMQRAVALVGAVVDECRVALDPDGLRIRAMDPATVAAVDLELAADAFDRYGSDGCRVGVDLGRLGDVLGMADAGQRVRFALDAETRTLRVTVGGLDYTLGLVATDAIRSPPDPADLAFDAGGEAVLPAAEVDRAVRAADMVSDHVALGIDADDGTFSAEAEGDTDDVSLALDSEDLVSLTPADAQSLFSIGYLKSIVREIPRDTDVSLRLGTEQPLAARFGFAEGDGSVAYFVSPRVSR